jgi:hypothetical protein
LVVEPNSKRFWALSRSAADAISVRPDSRFLIA